MRESGAMRRATLALLVGAASTPALAFTRPAVRLVRPRGTSFGPSELFASVEAPTRPTPPSSSPSRSPSSSTHPSLELLSMEEMNPWFTFSKGGKTKVVNATGAFHLLVIGLTLPFWIAAMQILQSLGDAVEGFDPNRSKFDYSGKIWCRAYLRLTGCYPQITGDVQRLRGKEGSAGTCLYVANHSSFLDIALLCCVLDPVFKFIAKDDLVKFPGVGKQLLGGEHVLIDRSNKRSQLRSFKKAITYLKDGVSVMAFPEGARSPDGRLMSFKGGAFSMAVKAGVPIVPLSISNAFAVMPGLGLVPVRSGEGKLRVHVHDAIGVEGKTEEEIAEEVREALLSELPPDQHPLAEADGKA